MSKVSQLLFFVWTSASFSISLSLDERMDGDGRTDGGHKKKTRLKKGKKNNNNKGKEVYHQYLQKARRTKRTSFVVVSLSRRNERHR